MTAPACAGGISDREVAPVYGIVILMAVIVGLVAVGFFFPLLWILAGVLVVLGVAWWVMATRRAAGERDPAA